MQKILRSILSTVDLTPMIATASIEYCLNLCSDQQSHLIQLIWAHFKEYNKSELFVSIIEPFVLQGSFS